MNKSIKKWLTRHALTMLAMATTLTASAQDSELIAEFKTNSYAQNGENNVVSVLIGAVEEGQYADIDYGYGKEEVELEIAAIDSTGSWTGSFVSCNVSPEGWIKIYGDASKINVLQVSGGYLTEADVTKMRNLAVLDLSHNELKSLDLTELTNLSALYLNDNPFKETPLKIGNDKPNLVILDIGQVGNLDPSFKLADYPMLVSFDAWHCLSLTSLDPSQNSYLKRISIDSCPVSSLDVTQNSNLQILNISETAINSIDLSGNPNLTQLYCDRQSTSLAGTTKLTSLDLSNNPYLTYLFANGNDLTSIDLSNNVYLTDIFLSYNKLTGIDVSKNTYLNRLMVRYNQMDFNSLPLPDEAWGEYDYTQSNMPVAKSQKVGNTLDLSARVLREGYTTECALFMTSDEDPNSLVQLDGEYYTYADGKVTFLKETSDSVYVAFSCNAFPESALDKTPLRTEKFMVKSEENYGKPDLAFTLTPAQATEIRLNVGIAGASAEEPKTFYVDYGDGVNVEYTATTQATPTTCNVQKDNVAGTLKVYVPENEKVSALAIYDIPLDNIDITPLHELGELAITNAGLTAIDLGWNRHLSTLTLTGNNFGSLNIRGANDAFQKTLLKDICLSGNNLTEVTLNDNYTIHNLDLSNNELSELSFKDADMMETVNLSGNNLISLDFNYCTLMTDLDISNNNISTLLLPKDNSLRTLRCGNNDLTFSTLPLPQELDTYVYAPQNKVTISKKGPGADLKSHNLNGQTVYVWKKKDGTVLQEGTDYTITEGRTRFLSQIIGDSVYCEMTHHIFPELTLTTTNIEAAEMPAHVLATFNTTEASNGKLRLRAYNNNTTICIDWKGAGVDYEEYIIGPDLSTFEVKSYDNCTAKVLAYSDNPGVYVFSCDSIAMSSFDASSMPGLLNLTVKNAGLESITMPNDKNSLMELNLDGNNFSEIDFSAYPNIVSLMLNYNKFSTFDASPYQSLGLLGLGGNQLESVTFDNPNIWSLDLGNNMISDIDLSKLPNLYQLAISHNKLTSIDISGLQGLNVLLIDHNRFRFSTLPSGENISVYVYADQETIDITCEDGKVDLSSEAVIDGNETTYRWFVDLPYFDEDTNELTGEELYIDEEYTVDNGVTTFLKPIDNVMCVMTNSKFPSLYLYTTLIDATTADDDAISAITENGKAADMSIYTTDGQLVRSTRADSIKAASSGLAKGLYIIKAGDKSIKTVVR